MSNLVKLGAVAALTGALMGGAIAWMMTATWVASGSVEVRPQSLRDSARRWVRQATTEVWSRSSLSELILRPSLDLYRAERTRLTLEDAIVSMNEALRIASVDAADGVTVKLSFTYPDAAKAQATLTEVEARFAALLSRIAEQDGSAASATVQAGEARRTPGGTMQIAFGSATGLMAGLALVLFRGRSLRWYATVLGLAVLGAASAEAAAYALEILYPADAQIGVLGLAAGAAAGMLWMGRRSIGRVGKLTAATIVGAGAAFALAFALPQVYESRSVLQVSAVAGSAEAGDAAARVGKVQDQVLSRVKLSELIQRPSLDLYRDERRRQPLEAVIQTMQENLRVTPAFHGGSEAAVVIEFRYPDRLKAQAVVREIVSYFMEEWNAMSRAAGQEPQTPGALRLEVTEPPGAPETAVAPDKPLMMAAGAGLGGGLLLLYWLLAGQPPARRRSMLRGTLGAGALAALLAGVIALALPVRYRSTAALRVVSPSGAARERRASELQNRLGEVLGSAGLIDLIQKPGVDLYARERHEVPVKDVLQLMRTRDLRVETMRVSPQGHTESLRIVFEYPDREKAGRFVQALVSALVEPGAGAEVLPDIKSERLKEAPGPKAESLLPGVAAQPQDLTRATRAYVEVMDPPSLPELPAMPERRSIAVAGIAAFLLLTGARLMVGRRERMA